MIIVSCKRECTIDNELIVSHDNNYLSSIEYIDNEFDEVLIKEIYFKYSVIYYDLNYDLHNPMGPAYISYIGETHSYYYLKGRRYSKEKFEETIKNDYYKH